jgi:hypothetical protein
MLEETEQSIYYRELFTAARWGVFEQYLRGYLARASLQDRDITLVNCVEEFLPKAVSFFDPARLFLAAPLG